MKWWGLHGALLVLALCSTVAYGQYHLCPCPPTAPSENPRTQSISLYLWVPGQHGDATVRGVPFDVDVSISDTWDALINNRKGAFAGHYENSKVPWTTILDVMYLNLENSVDTALGPLTFDSNNTIAEAAAAYTVGLSVPNAAHASRTEVLAGVRYTSLKLELTGLAGGDESGHQSWLDPFIGARYIRCFSPRCSGSVRGDVGGFGIGDASDFTWNAVVTLEYA